MHTGLLLFWERKFNMLRVIDTTHSCQFFYSRSVDMTHSCQFFYSRLHSFVVTIADNMMETSGMLFTRRSPFLFYTIPMVMEFTIQVIPFLSV